MVVGFLVDNDEVSLKLREMADPEALSTALIVGLDQVPPISFLATISTRTTMY